MSHSGKVLSKPLLALLVLLLLAGATDARSSGITGDQAEGDTDVAVSGCTCHSNNEFAPDDSVTLILDGVPYFWSEGTTYQLMIQLIGGPEMDTHSNTGGFSMKVSEGTLGPGDGYESLVQNGDETDTLTHTSAGAKTEDRTWHITWTAPASGSGDVTFWLAGNAVDGDGAPAAPDAWNRIAFSLSEGEDTGMTQAHYNSNGEIEPQAAGGDETNLHEMGAVFRAHWLGLLGFGAVILVILFCGFFLRYGFSSHYGGRTNLLKLRMKHLRRGDQL